MTDITNIISAFIALMSALITAFIIPWIKKRTTEEDREEMLKWIDIAVAAAQQLYHNLDGAERKVYVQDFLTSKGYNIDDLEVENAIEAAVLKLHHELYNNYDKEVNGPVANSKIETTSKRTTTRRKKTVESK